MHHRPTNSARAVAYQLLLAVSPPERTGHITEAAGRHARLSAAKVCDPHEQTPARVETERKRPMLARVVGWASRRGGRPLVVAGGRRQSDRWEALPNRFNRSPTCYGKAVCAKKEKEKKKKKEKGTSVGRRRCKDSDRAVTQRCDDQVEGVTGADWGGRGTR